MKFFVVMKVIFILLSQNGIVAKDLTRLKMLLSEIEVSVCGCWAVHLTVVSCPSFFMSFGGVFDGLMFAGESHKDD